MKTIGIFGIGAIGSLVSRYAIDNPSNHCVFFNRSQNHYTTIRFKEKTKKIKWDNSYPLDYNLDWLFICIKEYHIKDSIARLKELVTEKTNVVIFQNGINLATPYLCLPDPEKILETIIDCPVQRISSNNYWQLKPAKLILPINNIAFEFKQLFDNSEINIEITEDFRDKQWIKLIESSAIGSIQSYTNQDCSIFLNPKYQNELIKLIEEGIEVAISEGINIDRNLKIQLLKKINGYSKSKRSSMLSDKVMGKPLELDAKIGAIIKIANKNKVDVPNSKRILSLLVS